MFSINKVSYLDTRKTFFYRENNQSWNMPKDVLEFSSREVFKMRFSRVLDILI